MVRKTLIAGLVLALLGIAAAQIDCPVYHTVAYDNSTKIARCEPCPPNCSSCYWDQEAKKAQCTSCREKTFRNKDGGCSPCATGCEVCVGPGMSDCMVVSNSYFYDIQSKDIKKCAAGCASCDNKGNCVRCEQGYRHKNKVDANAVVQTLDDNVLVDCIKCADPKCNYCEVDALGTEFCAACQNEYGLNPKTKKCEPCPQGCLSCHSNNEICSFCKDGYQKVQGFPGCKPIDIPNCLNEDIENKKCIWCQSSFTPNAKNGGATCITCSVADPLCTHCREKTGNETSNNAMDLVCTGCPSRYTLNQDTNTCEACSPHCTYCSSKGDCYSCDAGYQLKDNKCEKVEVPNCEVPSSDKGCASCLPHFYVDRSDDNKCKPCHDSCLMCDGPGEDDCVSCSVDKYSLRVADENPFLDFFGSTKLRCVDKCPKEFNGKAYQEHELARECIAQTVEEAVPKSKYPFTRTQDNKSWTTIYHDSEDFFRDYLKHAKHSLDTSHHWARKHPKESAKYSSQCNFRGELVEKISASRETYYHCDCLKKYHGSNCEADHDLYEAVQKYALGAIKDMQDLEASFNEDQFSRTIINLCQAPLSMDTLSDVIKTINKLMSKQKHFKVNDVPQFLSVLDRLIQSFYKAKVELEHRSDGYQRDIGYQGFLKVMYAQFHSLINMGDMVFKESAGYQKNIVDASTHTFQVTDEVCNAKTFQEYNQLHVLSPNLLGLTELMVPATINIKNAYLAQNFQDTRMVIWSYSRHLFPPDKKYATHLVFMYPMHVIHHKATIVKPKWTEGDHVTVRFPIKVMPAAVDVKKSLLCVALHFAADDHISAVSEGEMVLVGTYDENATHFVTCKFDKKLAGFYYTVVYMNDDIPHTHLAKTAKALAMDDNFHLQVTLEQKPAVSSSMVIFVKTALLILVGILLSS